MVATNDSAVEPALSLITGIDVREWGREIAIEGLNDPLTRHGTRLVFSDCREIRWSFHGELVADTEADVIGLSLGQGNYLEAATITTDLFELTIQYGTVMIGTATANREAINAHLAAV